MGWAVVDGPSVAVGVCGGATWAMACFMKRCAAALSTSIRSKVVVVGWVQRRRGRNALVGGFSAAESFWKYCFTRSCPSVMNIIHADDS